MAGGAEVEASRVVEAAGAGVGAQDPGQELAGLVDILPPRIREAVAGKGSELMEVALDLGRPPEIRLHSAPPVVAEECGPVSRTDLSYIVAKLGARFRDDRRAGVDGTLHRISAIVNTRGEIVGVTMRVGRHVPGAAQALSGVLRQGKGVLLVGPPGSGKTTVLRDVCRFLSCEMNRKVVVVDTSGEIGGWGDVSHPAIGRARRLQVPEVTQQYRVMIEAVQNHTPEYVVIDEIGRPEEVDAARTIARRGVKLIATCHGRGISTVLSNPVLRPLMGVSASWEIEDSPVFDSLAEVSSPGRIAVHGDLRRAISWALRSKKGGRSG